MKKFTRMFMMVTIILAVNVNAQNYIEFDIDSKFGTMSSADIDNDGDYDVYVSGEDDMQDRYNALYLNNGDGTYSKQDISITPLTFTTIDWTDIDGDGDLDLLQNGFDQQGGATWEAWLNDGNGGFTKDEALSSAIINHAITTRAVDLDNDGLLDILAFGNTPNEGTSKIYFNNGDGTFTESAQFETYSWWDPNVTCVDYDLDGDIDLFVNAWSNNTGENGSRWVRIFQNDGLGVFIEVNPQLIEKSFGSANWADYDADGFADVLLNGDGGASGEDASNIYRLYKNNGDDTFTEITTFSKYRQGAVGDGGVMLDWDNDGLFDVVVTGWNEDEVNQKTVIYKNNGDDTFTALPEAIPGVSESSVLPTDMDGDGALDLLVTGFSGDLDFSASAFAYQNSMDISNTAPSAPTNPTQVVDGRSVTLSWDTGDDTETPTNGLTYNLYLKNTTTGDWYIFPKADVSTGFRMVFEHGNVWQNGSWTFNDLAGGEYAWGVQSIDAGFKGSSFTDEQTFTIEATSIPEHLFANTISLYPNPVTNGSFMLVNNNNDISTVKIHSLEGKMIMEWTKDSDKYVVSDLKNGVYIVMITNQKGEVASKKLVIQ
ncbi:MAG: FG-GAP-like repeat-containing protein [Bacteroidales bacterium]|nr:FG-GAP-like repeat-containing protein [Bacteroidales bacterium]